MAPPSPLAKQKKKVPALYSWKSTTKTTDKFIGDYFGNPSPEA
jgi:hypothetical protein